MDPVSLASAALLGLTLAGLTLLVSAVARRERRGRDELLSYAHDLAAQRHAQLLGWRRGWAIIGEKGRVGFTADVHTTAKATAENGGGVAVWRIEVAPHAAVADLQLRLDSEGNLSARDPGGARTVLDHPRVRGALDGLLKTRPVRVLELEHGVLAVQLEQVTSTVKELERCRAAVEHLALAIDVVARARSLPARDEHGLGPASGVPVPVRAQ